MTAVDIGIRHQNNLMVSKLCNIEVIAVALGKTAAEGIDHRLDFRIGENLIHGSLLHI